MNDFPLEAAVGFGLLFLYAFFQGVLEHYKVSFLHESGLVLMLSVAVSALLKYSSLNLAMTFSDQELFYMVLPPIIFSAGFNMKKRQFFRYLPYICMFGLVGTCLHFMTMTGIMILFNQQDLFTYSFQSEASPFRLENREIAMFAGIICSSDVVAPLTLLDSRKHPKVFSIVFGEGIVNDAMSIILFQCVVLVVDSSQSGTFKWTALLLKLVYVSVCSLLIGIIAGVLPALLLKWSHRLRLPAINQVVLLMFFGMASYMTCEFLGLSGILSLLVSSVLMSHYAYYNLSPQGQHSASIFFSTLSYLAEAFIFIYLGLCSMLRDTRWSMSLAGYSLLAVLLSRFMAITLTSLFFRLLYKALSRPFLLDSYELLIIYISGSIRGAIAYGLVLSVHTPHADVVKSSCLLMVLVTTILFGALMGLIIKGLLYLKNRKQQQPNRPPSESDTKSNLFFKPISNEPLDQPAPSGVSAWWKRIDGRVLKKYLVVDFQSRQQQFQLIKEAYNTVPDQAEDIKYSSMKYCQVSDICKQTSLMPKHDGDESQQDMIIIESLTKKITEFNRQPKEEKDPLKEGLLEKKKKEEEEGEKEIREKEGDIREKEGEIREKIGELDLETGDKKSVEW